MEIVNESASFDCTPDTLSMIYKICVIEPEKIRIHRTTSRPILPLNSTGARKKGRGKTSLDGDPEFREYSDIYNLLVKPGF